MLGALSLDRCGHPGGQFDLRAVGCIALCDLYVAAFVVPARLLSRMTGALSTCRTPGKLPILPSR
ncbi:DUF2125 domain-containing protein [Nonomuraea dietziae]